MGEGALVMLSAASCSGKATASNAPEQLGNNIKNGFKNALSASPHSGVPMGYNFKNRESIKRKHPAKKKASYKKHQPQSSPLSTEGEKGRTPPDSPGSVVETVQANLELPTLPASLLNQIQHWQLQTQLTHIGQPLLRNAHPCIILAVEHWLLDQQKRKAVGGGVKVAVNLTEDLEKF